MVNDLPTYLRGDTIGFRVELEHDFNLGDARAVFYGQEEQEGADPFPPVELSAKVVGCCESSQPTTFSASRASVYSPNFLEVWNSQGFAASGQERAGVWYAQGAIEKVGFVLMEAPPEKD